MIFTDHCACMGYHYMSLYKFVETLYFILTYITESFFFVFVFCFVLFCFSIFIALYLGLDYITESCDVHVLMSNEKINKFSVPALLFFGDFSNFFLFCKFLVITSQRCLRSSNFGCSLANVQDTVQSSFVVKGGAYLPKQQNKKCRLLIFGYHSQCGVKYGYFRAVS